MAQVCYGGQVSGRPLDAGKAVAMRIPHPKLESAARFTIAFAFSALLVYASIKYDIPNTDVMG